MRLRRSLAAVLVLALAASPLSAAVSLIGQVGQLLRADTTTPVPAGSVVILVADTDKATSPGLANPLGTTLRAGSTLGGASGDLIVGVYQASDLGDGVIGVDFGGTTLAYTGALTAGTDLYLLWFPGVSTVGNVVGSAQPFGAYRSDTVDRNGGSDIAFVTPSDGATVTLNAFDTGLGGLATAAQLSATHVTAPAVATAGTYFGTFTNGGNWALYVRPDGTGTFIAYSPSRHVSTVLQLNVGPNGVFAATSPGNGAASTVNALSLANPEAPRRAAAATVLALNGQIQSDGTVTGTLAAFSDTFTGAIDNAAPTAPAGLYQTAALNAASGTGTATAIVGPSGQAVIVTTGSILDGAAGTVSASGQLTATTGDGGTLALTINSATQTLNASLTPAGSGTPVTYAGLPEGVASTTRVVNLSVRSAAGTGSQTLIVGFVITGSGGKNLLVRGIGPGIAQAVPEALTDPSMRLLDGTGYELAANTDWASGLSTTFASLGASALATGSKDAAIYRSVPAGVYSFHVFPGDTGSGVALAELYDGDLTVPTAQVVNLSARTQVGTGANILIAGFVVTGNAPKTLLIRGVGPSLAGVAGALADPQLYLFDNQNHVLANNDNWGGTAALKTAFATVGAGALASDTSKDAALLVTVNPGIYSAQVSGVANTTGVALVEIFLMP